MTKRDLDKISDNLKSIPVDALQRAALLYAAKRLRASGEKIGDAIMLLEQMAGEHYDEMTIVREVG